MRGEKITQPGYDKFLEICRAPKLPQEPPRYPDPAKLFKEWRDAARSMRPQRFLPSVACFFLGHERCEIRKVIHTFPGGYVQMVEDEGFCVRCNKAMP